MLEKWVSGDGRDLTVTVSVRSGETRGIAEVRKRMCKRAGECD